MDDRVIPLDAETKVAERPADHEAELRLWLRLLTCTTLIEGEVRRRLRDEFDVTLPRFDLMAQLDKAPNGMTLGELSQRMMVSNGNVTGLVERLAQAGLIDPESFSAPDGQIVPSWTVRETWYWRQTFPAGRPLRVEHSYTPGVGGTAGVPLASPDYRASQDGRRAQAEFCTDRDFLASIDRMSQRAERQQGNYPTESRIRYILTTGGNWRAPIGDFRLVVDKGRPDAIVSFCGEGVRRISPTRFEVRHRNWRPDRDLAVLIVSAEPQRE